MQTAIAKHDQCFDVRLATTDADIQAAQALRYRVFVEELGGDGPLVDHQQRLEIDPFDRHCDHLLLRETETNSVIGVYRLMSQNAADLAGGFYSETEFDLTKLKSSGRKVLELGRSCLHKNYRGGMAMFHLWAALSDYIDRYNVDILFGVASFHGTDIQTLAQPLSHLHTTHLAPSHLRPVVLPPHGVALDQVPAEHVDRKQAMQQTPQLIKAYLRLGGTVGQGAFVDHAFNTTDVCLMLDVTNMNPRQRQIYQRGIS
jgi:putative hemolysin